MQGSTGGQDDEEARCEEDVSDDGVDEETVDDEELNSQHTESVPQAGPAVPPWSRQRMTSIQFEQVFDAFPDDADEVLDP